MPDGGHERILSSLYLIDFGCSGAADTLKALIRLEGTHAFCVSIFGRVEHLRARIINVVARVSRRPIPVLGLSADGLHRR
jgi:hypothetical protein